MRLAFAIAFAAVLAPSPNIGIAAEPMPETVRWTVEPTDRVAAGEVQFTLSYRSRGGRSMWSSGIALSELQGLEAADLGARQAAPVRFRIIREAGQFDCAGEAGMGRGEGSCRFDPNEIFAASLVARGIGAPTFSQQYSLALARVGTPLLDELDRQAYARPSIDDLVAAGIHDVGPEFVSAMSEAGYRVGTVAGLVQMRIHGVSRDYVAALADAGYRPEAEDLVAFRIHGVSPEFIRAIDRSGGGRYGTDELIAMRIHGVDADFVRELADLGYTNLEADELTSMRIHGVTPAFVRRAIARNDARPTASELVSRRIHGE